MSLLLTVLLSLAQVALPAPPTGLSVIRNATTGMPVLRWQAAADATGGYAGTLYIRDLAGVWQPHAVMPLSSNSTTLMFTWPWGSSGGKYAFTVHSVLSSPRVMGPPSAMVQEP